MFDVITPISSPPVSKPLPVLPKPPQLDWLDERIVELVEERGPVKIWSILNLLGEEMGARSRGDGRQARMQLLPKVQRLLRLGLLHRAGRNTIATFKPVAGTKRRRQRTARKASFARTGSALMRPQPAAPAGHADQPHVEVFSANPDSQQTPPNGLQTQTVLAPEDVSSAARQLASLPRRKKRIWSGWLDDQTRAYRNMRIELPGGEPVYVFGVLRGRLVFTRVPNGPAGDPDEAGQSWGVVPASAVQIIPNQHAVVLGRLKAGTRERPSVLKAATARRNGAMPARRGRRGRPRKLTSPQ